MAVSPEVASRALEWLHMFHDAGDSLDANRWIKAFFTPDAELNFGNDPSIHGHEAIISTMSLQMANLSLMKHDVHHVSVLLDKIYQEATIHYIVKNDPTQEKISVKGFAVFHKGIQDEKVHKFDVYGDFSKLVEKVVKYAS